MNWREKLVFPKFTSVCSSHSYRMMHDCIMKRNKKWLEKLGEKIPIVIVSSCAGWGW